MKATPNHGIRYPEPSDPNLLALYFQQVAEDAERELEAIEPSQLVVPGGSDGKLVIVNSGAAAYKAMSGDATIDEDGNFRLGNGVVDTEELVDKAVTGGKIDDGAVAEGKLADGAAGTAKLATAAKELFLQLASSGAHKVKWGIYEKGGLGSLTYQTVTHGMAATPQIVIPFMANGQYQTIVTADEYAKETFRLGGYRTDGANIGTIKAGWFAIS